MGKTGKNCGKYYNNENLKPQTRWMINKIEPYLFRGESYTATMRAVRSEYRMCENTFMKYWKIARQYHWEHWRYITKIIEEKRKADQK